MKAKIKAFLPIFIFLLVLVGVEAQPSGIFGGETFTEGFVLDFPIIENHKEGEDINLAVHVMNITTGHVINPNLVSCKAHMFNSTGHHILEVDISSLHEEHFELSAAGGNISTVGLYGFNLHCNDSRLGGFYSGTFLVTKNGIGDIDGNSIAFIILIIGLSFLFIYLAISLREEHSILSIILILFTFILLLIGSNIFSDIADSTISTAMQGRADNIHNAVIILFVMVMFYVFVYFLLQVLWQKKEGLGGNMNG